MGDSVRLYIKSVVYSAKVLLSIGKMNLIAYLGINIISALLPLASIYIFNVLLDMLLYQKDRIDTSTIIVMVSLYICSLIGVYIVSGISEILYSAITDKAVNKIELIILEKQKTLPISLVDSLEGQDFLVYTRCANSSVPFIFLNLLNVVSHVLSFSVAIVVILEYNLWICLLYLLVAIPSVVARVLFKNKLLEYNVSYGPLRKKYQYYRWMLRDAWPSKDVRVYNLTDPIKERYQEERQEYVSKIKKMDKKNLYTSLSIEMVHKSIEALFIFKLISDAISGSISIGQVTLYLGYLLSATAAFKSIIEVSYGGFNEANTYMKKYFEYLEIETIEEQCGERKLEAFESLSFENVYFKYPKTDKYILKGASFILNKGDKLSIIGINGSGKSTIIKVMLGLYPIESGQILINGYPLGEYTIQDVRKMFSALFQTFVQYPLTLRENIVLSDLGRYEKDDEIIEVLKKSGIHNNLSNKISKDKVSSLLDTYMTRQFDDQGIELSKGQWQKIALSRAYFKNAEVIIFDEPSSALDAEAEDQIFRNFEEIADQKTGIMISHRISSAKIANKIIVLDEGKIVEQGMHDELINTDGIYAKLYNLQLQKYTIKEA